MTFDVPILFLIFNRPDTTARVFENIRGIRPQKLFIAADGPRENKENENEKCQLVRKLVLENIDWPCEVKTLFRDNNLGCGSAVSGALTWFFENVEEGIVLEDDVLPDPSFYHFCRDLLNRYRNDERIRFINGCNFGYKGIHEQSYGFTSFMNMWGWASWRRSINMVDQTMQTWKTLKDKNNFLEKIFEKQQPRVKSLAGSYFREIFDDTAAGKKDTWDYQCIFSNLLTETYAVFPAVNLVSNLGFGTEATHTNFNSYFLSEMKTRPMSFPMHHPTVMIEDSQFQEFLLERWAGLRFRSRIYYSIFDKVFKIRRIFSGKSI